MLLLCLATVLFVKQQTERMQVKWRNAKKYRKFIVGVLFSLPHRPGILEFMDFIYCVEAGERESLSLSKLKLLLAIYSLIGTGWLLCFRSNTVQTRSRLGLPDSMALANLIYLHQKGLALPTQDINASQTSLGGYKGSLACQTCR